MNFQAAFVASVLALATLACDADPGEDRAVGEDTEAGAYQTDQAGQTFVAQLSPLNAHLLDATPSGEVRLEVRGDSLTIMVDVQGVPPEMMHLQHFHGFEDGSPARCPGADADENGDGVVDVTETAALAGTTMVPFHGDPENMEIDGDTYPVADEQGSYSYRQTVPLEGVRSAFQEKFGGSLHLDRRVVFIHGIPEHIELPGTAATKAGLPARVTLPIACGELR
jgi:hypothetical protein